MHGPKPCALPLGDTPLQKNNDRKISITSENYSKQAQFWLADDRLGDDETDKFNFSE